MKRIHIPLLSISIALLSVMGLLLLCQYSLVLAEPVPVQSEVIKTGLAYLQAQQQADGGILGFSGVSDPDTTARSVMAFIAVGSPITDALSSEGHSMLDYLTTQAITFTHDTTGTLFPGRAGILLSAISLVGEDTGKFGGMDLVGELEASFQNNTGAYSTSAHQDFSSGEASDQSQAWAVLGLSLAGKSVPEAAIQYLAKSQGQDGSWGMGDPDTTAIVVTALIASHSLDNQSTTIQNAINYFHTTQLDSAGWRPSWDTDPLNADSSGWIIQALVSAGEDLRGQSWMKNQTNPVDALMGLQKPDGSIGGQYANTYSTAEAIIGLAGIPLTNLGVSQVVHKAGLAVFWGDNSLYTSCISFTESSITGLDLLERSGLAIETATNPNQGTAVCKIGQVGDASNNCFGSMPNYWAYFTMSPTGWEYSVTGSSQTKAVDGDVNAWSWSTGDQPPLITYQNICEGVAYVLPTAVQATTAPTASAEPTASATSTIPASVTPGTAPTATAQRNTGTYIVYASILLVLGVLILLLFRGRRK